MFIGLFCTTLTFCVTSLKPCLCTAQDVLHATSHHLAACSTLSRPIPLTSTSRVTSSDPRSPSPIACQPQPCSPLHDNPASAGFSTSDHQSDTEPASLSARQGAVCCDTIIVHGAGSFGHHQAHLHGVSRGPLTDPHVRAGFAATRYGPGSCKLFGISFIHSTKQGSMSTL